MRTDARPTAPRYRSAAAIVVAGAALVAGCTGGETGDPNRPDGSVVATSTPTETTLGTASTSEPGRPPVTDPAAVPSEVIDGFDDHTVSMLRSVDDFHAMARTGVSDQSVVKFAIPQMPANDDVRWLDSNFYALHDEWYWFRLMNGRTVPGFETTPVVGASFETVADIVTWAQGTADLPLDLRFVESRTHGQRLYSNRFYADGMPTGRRNFGLGSLVFLPDASDGDDHWLFELEYSDDATPAEIDRYFSLLEATLPAEIAERLEWVVRSPEQADVAGEMAAGTLRRHDRIVRWSELIVPGATQVYNAGITAGRLLIIDGVNTQLSDATENDILLVENVPDWLPPAAALISSSPQTPLAHVNLLARNRGIPNASRSGVLDDASLQQAARVRAPAIVRSEPDGSLDIVLIANDEYRAWRDLQRRAPIAVPSVDVESLPVTMTLGDVASTIARDDEIDALRPIIGGKSAGFLTLLAAPRVTTPLDPIAITVRPYVEHVAQVDDALTALLAFDDFADSAAVRFLFLEGLDDYLEAYPDPDDADRAQGLFDDHPTGSPLGDILEARGFQRYLRDRPIDPGTLGAIRAAIDESFGEYADTQGIRFRSSSSVEDIEGFTGAGLYDSNTGFPVPDPTDDDRDKTVEEAILETWASYWSFEAFEERRLERVDHRSGAMGILVHARFDDPLELDNGVATFTLLPESSPDHAVAVVNTQAGDLSVANPDDDELPEVVEVRSTDAGRLVIERVATSTVAGPAEVMTDAAITELFEQLESVTLLWRERINASLPATQRVETVTLDFEFKTMAAGWPDITGRTPLPSRLVVKQARSLDPGLRDVAPELLDLPIPRDVLARARQIVRTCDGDIATIELLTDPLRTPDVGYADVPFVLQVDEPACVPDTLLATPAQFLLTLLDASDPS